MKLAKIRFVVSRLKEDDKPRALNRARIIEQCNGGAPYTEEEAAENKIETNVQPLMAPRLMHDARRQMSGATTRTSNFFKVNVDTGNEASDSVASYIITKKINKVLKRSLKYLETLRGQDANVVLHGKGTVVWEDANYWCPKVIGVEDFKVPSGTKIDFSNLTHFAIREEWSAAELMRKVSGKRVYPGWNVAEVKKLIRKLTEEATQSKQVDDEFPEKLAKDFKENAVFYASDNVPTADCWRFYELTEDRDGPKWKYYIFLDEAESGKKDGFLFEQKRKLVDDLSQLLHTQYADGTNDAPFKYHSVRGLGYLLYPLLHSINRFFCRAMDSYFESCNQMFVANSEEDRERLQSVNLANMSVIPSNVRFVTANERYSINHNVMNAAFSMLRQFISENSSSFTEDTDSGTERDETATKTMAKLQQANAMVSSMLGMQYTYRGFQFNEVARRFTIPKSKDKDVLKFQQDCLKEGLGPEHLNYENWTVVPEQVIGGGNKVLELAMTKELMAIRPAYPPQAQTEILRDFTLALTDDPDKATRWVPAEPPPPSSSAVHANLAFGSLMDGAEVIMPQGINLDEYVQVLMMMLFKQLEMIKQAGSVPSVDKVMGLQQLGRHVGEVLNQLVQDPTKQDQIMVAIEQLKQMMVRVAELADAALEQQQASAGGNQELQAKLYEKKVLADAQADVIRNKGAQQREQKAATFQQKEAQNVVKLQSELEAKDYTTAAELNAQTARARTDIAVAQEKAAVDIAAAKEKAKNAPKPKK